MATNEKALAIVTNASSGIGYELAKQCAENRFNLILVADEPAVQNAAQTCRELGAQVTALQVDLATESGFRQVFAAVAGQPVDALLVNATKGSGYAFLDEDFQEAEHAVAKNVIGIMHLIHRVAGEMQARGKGHILIMSSLPELGSGCCSAVYNGTRAFVDSFAMALRTELKDAGVTVTSLQPNTTNLSDLAGPHLLNTRAGLVNRNNQAKVAQIGFNAMLEGQWYIVSDLTFKSRETVREHASLDLWERLMAQKVNPEMIPGTAS